MKKMNNKGFTIVELVIVIAVIAILAAVMIPTFSGVVKNANESAAIQEVKAALAETLADELGPNGTKLLTADGVTYPINVQATNGTIVQLTATGVASVASGQNLTVGYKVEGNKIVVKTN